MLSSFHLDLARALRADQLPSFVNLTLVNESIYLYRILSVPLQRGGNAEVVLGNAEVVLSRRDFC